MLITITPQIAKSILKGTFNPRLKSEGVTGAIGNRIKDGKWRVSKKNPLVFSKENGMLIDGYHRVVAIANIGITVKIHIRYV